MRTKRLWTGPIAVASAVLALGFAQDETRLAAPVPHGASPGVPVERHDDGYVGSSACADCHAHNHETWSASFHRRMTQAPSRAAILAPFRGTTPVLEGVAWKLEQHEDDFFVQPVSAHGDALGKRARVALTTGSHHYQVYWYVTEGESGLHQLPLVWHLGEQRWVPRKAMFLLPPGSTGDETDRWQAVCIKCHTTHGTPKAKEEPATRVAELGIACEACHGPAAEHVRLQRANRAAGKEDEPDRTLVDPSELAHERSTQVCGQCHGIHVFATQTERESWESAGFAFKPGDDLGATRTLLRGTLEKNTEALRAFLARNPDTLAELYWKDGEVRVSGREYNGLAESQCFLRGELACVSCHEMHEEKDDPRPLASWASDQLRPGMDGPGACLPCHGEYAEPAKLTAHTHHGASSSGSDCLNCHMPYTTYGLTKAIRSHRIASPEARVAAESARPSACNLCHLDRSLGWTADRLKEWYGRERPALDADRESVAASVLWALTGDAGTRALAAWALGWPPARAVSGTGWMPFLESTLAMDDYDAVRWIAVQTLRREPRYERFTLDFCAELEEQRNHVRETVLSDWLKDGLECSPAQRAALLIGADGKLDQARFLALYRTRDNRPVRLSE